MSFEVLEKKKVYSGRLLIVGVDKVKLPNKEVVTREVVDHIGSVAIIPILNEEEIILINQFRYATENRIWEIPAGTLKKGEKPEDCALRELEEEIGYKADRLDLLSEFYPTPGFCREKIKLYKATNLTKTKQNLESDEDLEVKTIKIEEALRMVKEGQIIDAKTIVAILWIT